ncbi:coagulation factor IXa [Phycodurus eques]|uniref:coagulation factor IXa n=1 Tax=Phycodurus eques TaxID=693459 RepID=UPI002ACDDFE5|nr:coagulation factor IXa [Phycodurus eques]
MCKHNHCALWSLCLFVMANFFLACALLSSFQLSLAGPVFVSGKAAHGVLWRHKRENRGVFEELLEGNLERECVEEICDFEEAREIFENTEKTVEFWNAYMDGDQCKLKPCLHKATCNDGIGSYTCKCRNGFSGVNCEIDLQKRCDLNNGDCGHFCKSMGHAGGKCYCAEGYKLMQDGISCEPEVEFACGRTALMRTPRSLVLTSNTTGPETLTRIVGGDFVTPAEIPWQAALVDSKSGAVFCGGSILREQWVITAAHCLAEALGPFYVRVGEYNIKVKEDTEQDIQVSQQHMFPLYNASVSLHDHDIALLHLQTPINFSTDVRPICIGPQAFTEALVKSASPATVSGWGRTRYLGLPSNTLKKVEVPFTSRTDCKFTSSARITPAMFCAGYYDESKDACQGDSGGPHSNRRHNTWFLTGIVSWGEECAKDGKYGVYTRVSTYSKWIHNMIHGLDHHEVTPRPEDDMGLLP